MAEQRTTDTWPVVGPLKADLKALYGISLAIATAVFFICVMKGIDVVGSLPKGSAIDFAVLSLGISLVLLSIGTMAINNFILLGEKKNWSDVWSRDMLEYFTSAAIAERWRVARGRLILSFATFFSGFAICLSYSFFRSLGA